MASSLRMRLAADFALLTLVLVVGGGVIIYHSFKDHCLEDLDLKLSQTLEHLRLNCVTGQDGPEVTLPVETRPKATPRDEAASLWSLVRLPDGTVLHRSTDLGPIPDLPMLNGTMAAPVFADLTLPNGLPVRVAGQIVEPPTRLGVARTEGQEREVHLTAAASRQPVLDYLAQVRRTIYAVAALSLLALTVLAAWLVDRALHPIRSLSREISRFPVGSPSRFSVPRSAVELEPVVGRLNNLMERVGRTLARERGFAMGAAHELRTPLAGLRARLELALSRPRSAEEYRAELHEALEIERGLESMVSHLLLLARLGQEGASTFVTKPLNLSRLLRQSWGEFFDRAEERRLRVSIRVPEHGPELHTSEDLVGLLIRNLFDNAVSYTPEEGRIEIIAQPVAAGWEISVSNTNPGLLEHDLSRLVEPFWRARHHEASQDGRHAGLGLALCQRILHELGGSLSHSLTDDGMVRAQVTLPLRPPSPTERGSGL